ncbi:MAG: hypothetical protein PHV30_06950 [Candidatus Margulisbacteria bacterium]|nr:hypothetical protein [Candidatus Margulisiibacteriota bacterium]
MLFAKACVSSYMDDNLDILQEMVRLWLLYANHKLRNKKYAFILQDKDMFSLFHDKYIFQIVMYLLILGDYYQAGCKEKIVPPDRLRQSEMDGAETVIKNFIKSCDKDEKWKQIKELNEVVSITADNDVEMLSFLVLNKKQRGDI